MANVGSSSSKSVVSNWSEDRSLEEAKPGMLTTGRASQVGRRDALRLIGAGLGASVAGMIGQELLATAGQTELPEGDRYIDSHVHVWTPDMRKYPLSKNFKESDMAPASFTPEELFVHTKPCGVGRIVLIQMNFYEFDNSYMTDCIKQYPGVFAGVGIVDHSLAGVVSEMKRLKGLGVRGFRLYADSKSVEGWKEDQGIASMWQEGSESGQAMCLLSNPDSLDGILEMCRRYPMTRVVIDHFSRIGMKGPVDRQQLEKLCSLSAYENVYVKTSAFYALGKKAAPYADLVPLIEKLVQEFGASRLMWGSDCPYQVEGEHTYEASIGLVRDLISSLKAEDRAWILGKTAEKVFF